MRNKIFIGIGIIVLMTTTFYLSIDNPTLDSKELVSNNFQKENSAYKAWSISGLSSDLSSSKLSQIDFMNENSMKGTYIEVNKNDSFKRKAATDEIYYLYSGACTAIVSGIEQGFNNGDVIFVKKGSDINFDDTTELLKIVKVSMVLDSNSEAPNWKHFSESNIVASRSSGGNEWNPFIRHSNVIFGMYMLPQSVNGDNRLVHAWQELNIVTSGGSKFVMDTDAIDVEEGSIVFVEEANGHYFDALKKDIDILILWEQRDAPHERH